MRGPSGHIWGGWREKVDTFGRKVNTSGQKLNTWPRNTVNTCAGPRDASRRKPLQAPGIIRDAVTHDPTAGGGSL